jgi:oligopeptidase A
LHIFDGGYAAGYYSYLWAEVLAADVYEEFQKKGIFDRETGLRYLHEILEVGSSRPMKESFIAFRGRNPDAQYLLKQYGILEMDVV